MLRYIILVFLLNTRFTSLGKSIPDNIGLELDALSTVCVNNFLKDQIEKKVSTCSVKLPPYNEDYLRCLLFYDMSKQLCDAARTDKLDLHEEQIQELSKPMTVVNVCTSAATWNVTNIPQYPEYKFKMDKITGALFSCAVLCSEDPMSIHAKFACQYYNWGFNILNKTHQQPPDKAPKNEVTLPSENAINDVNNLKTPVVSVSENNDVSSIQDVGQEHSPFSKPSDAQPQIKQEPSTVDSTASSNKVEANIVPTIKGQQPTDIQKLKSVPEIPSHNSAVEKPIFEEEKPPQKSESEKNSDINLNNVKDLGEDSKIKSIDGDDYPNAELEGDEGKDGLADTQGGDDGDGEPMPDVDMKMTNQEQIIKKIDTSIAALQGGVLSEREYVSNTFPEAFSPSDDHFFPIFLSAIVIIIVLYVLYHNKNKVTKVVLGLLIEGRQSGRRRNSRGHAYRRLDTLEQAMSANSAAPPSKIIY